MSYDKSKPSDYDGMFQKAADTHGVSYDLLRKLAFNESSFNPQAKSKTGPKGIMQFTTGTARGLGLNVADVGIDDPSDDRYNPELAIDAGARHLSDLVRKFNGDELKAALAYNQGEGANGAYQMQAYDRGDFSGISEEGRNYMRKLIDVANSPRKGELEAFGGITPKGKGIPAEDAFKGLSESGKVGTELPQSASFNMEGVAQQAPKKGFQQDFWEQHGQTVGDYLDRGTFSGFGDAVKAELANSPLGMAVRAARSDNSWDVFRDNLTPTKWNSYEPTAEDIQKLRDSGLPPSYYHVVTGGDGENWDALIDVAKQNYEYDKKAGDAGMGAMLTAGIIGAGADPLSYVPLVGVAGKGLKVVNKALIVGTQSAGLNVASEALRTNLAGGEAHYLNAALGGLVFGAGMSALADAVRGGLKQRNEFHGPSLRLEARETAINTGGPDHTTVPTEGRTFEEHAGVEYSKLDTEPGAVVLKNGSILSDTNPTNPQTIKEFSEIDPERSAGGISLGRFTEIGLTLLRSESNDVRGLASDLVRSPVGMQSGSNGKMGATSSDIMERTHAADNRDHNTLYDVMRTAMEDPQYNVGYFNGREAAKQDIYRKVSLAIERPEDNHNLTKAEKKVLEVVKGHFDTKRELMENPAMFGNRNAVSIFPESRHKGTYIPNVYDRAAKAIKIKQYGNDGLQEGIAGSMLASYDLRPATKARVDDYLKELHGVDEVTPEMVRKYAMDKAYGISHSDQFTASSVVEDNLTGLVGIENNSFLEARHMFDSDVAFTMPDGESFSLNDLRDFDMGNIMPAYDRRVNGDIAIMAGTGKTTKELKDEVLAIKKKADDSGDGKLKAEADALMDTIKILTGRARRNQDGIWETALRSLQDMTFFSKNFYMGPQNITEISGMLAKGNVKAVLHGVPVVNEMVTRKSVFGAKEMKNIHSAVFGRELDMLIRPGREDIAQRLRENTNASNLAVNAVSTLKFATQELSARSPWTKMLNGTANYILDAARQGVLGDVAGAALAGKGSKFGKDNFLKSASISKEQWAGIKQLFVDHASRGENGQFTIKDKKAFAQDPRAMDLWRLADKVADETMLRPHKVSSQDTKASNTMVKMVMQFKNFVIKSLNSKFIRSFYETTKNSRAIDQALTHVLSLGIAGGYFAMQAHVKATALPEYQQKDYLTKTLNPKMLAYAAVTRSSHLGAPLAVGSMIAGGLFGVNDANLLRSTITPKDTTKPKPDRSVTSREVLSDIGGNLATAIPGLGYVASMGATAMDAAGVISAGNKTTERDYMTGLMNATRELVPNDPLTQQLIMKIYEVQGVYTKNPNPQ